MMGIEHLRNLEVLPGATVTAIADPNVPSLEAALAAIPEPGDVATFADHRALLESGRCDAVVIASPNMTHAAVLDDVLATDLHTAEPAAAPAPPSSATPTRCGPTSRRSPKRH